MVSLMLYGLFLLVLLVVVQFFLFREVNRDRKRHHRDPRRGSPGQ
jgi:hypothetical protein